MTVQTPEVAAYRQFHVEVAGLRRLGPSFLRVTFTGVDLDRFASNGHDQRIKVVFPLPRIGLRHCPSGPDWRAAWRSLPTERRNPLRTYTVRAARPDRREVDVDFVLHGGTGPATAWAENATLGDEVLLIGPNAAFPGATGGFEWKPPTDASALLLAGDETAVAAVCAIAEGLPADTRATVLLEVPAAEDVLDVAVPPGVEMTWLPRAPAGTARGQLLVGAVAEAVRDLAAPTAPATELADIDIDAGILWEVPACTTSTSGPYAWLAGEAAIIKSLRRQLLQDAGMDRSSVAFMGYWRDGRVE